MQCDTIERIHDDVLREVEDAVALALLIVSVFVGILGHRLARLLGGVGAALATACAVFFITPPVFHLSCELRLGATVVAASFAALLAVCILRVGILAIGATAFAIPAHFAYKTVSFYGQEGYWITLGVASSIGAAIAWAQQTYLLRLCGIVLGSLGVAIALEELNVSAPMWSVFLTACIVFAFLQLALSGRFRRVHPE